MGASTYLEKQTLNYFFRGETVPQPKNLYLGLFINSPGEDGRGTEVEGGNYEREEVSFKEPTLAGNKSVIENIAKIEFNIAEENWGEISHWGVYDSKADGNLLTFGAFDRVQDVMAGNQFVINEGNLQISVE